MFKKGDTLVEVTIAIGIFSMVAIAVASVMNSSTSDAQLALETTITREEVDAQAEALRFIHDSYASNKQSSAHPTSQLWQEIISHAVNVEELGDNPEELLQYTPTSCANLFENSILQDNAFVINTRKLNEGTDAFIKYDSETFLSPSTYSRLVFDDSEGATLYDASFNKNISSVEGLYVVAVTPEDESYYDFYIRTCWYGGGTSDPSAISTVIRLYNSDQVSSEKIYYFTASLFNLPSSDKIEIGRTKKLKLAEYVEKKDGYSFVGWCTKPTNNEFCSGQTLSTRDIFYSSEIGRHYDFYAMWKINTYNLAVNFAGKGISSVKVCTVSGNCSGNNLMGTVSSNGSMVGGLTYGKTYYLYPVFATGHGLGSWAKTSSTGTLSSTSAANPTFTMGAGNGAVKITGKANTYGLTANFAGSGVSSIKICTVSGNCSGDNLKGTISISGGKVSGLTYGTSYYLYPVFATGHSLSGWTKTSSVGTLDLASTANPTFKMGAGDGAVTLTGKVNTYGLNIRFAGSGVSSVKVCTVGGNCSGSNLKGTISSSGGRVNGLTYGVAYYLYPIFATGYSVNSWAKTSSTGTLSSTSAANPTFKMGAGDGAVTLTGKINNYNCTKRYRLQNADGSYPGYTTEATSSMAYNSTCSYSKSVSYYTTKSGSCKVTTSGCTISLDLPRTTYTLTVNRDTRYLGSTSGAGTYRWGQGVSIGATAFIGSFTYWSVSSGSSGSFANSLSRSTTYTMPKGNSTVYANAFSGYIQDMNASLCSRIASSGAYTVTDNRDSNAYKVRFLNSRCWTLDNLRLNLTDSRVKNVMSEANTNAASKAISCLLRRSSACYSPYATSQVTSNNDSSWWPSYSSERRGRPYIHVHLKDNTVTSYGAGSGKRGIFYDYCAASAGSFCPDYDGYYSSSTNTLTSDICPSGWRIPTESMYSSLLSAYTNRSASNSSSFQYNLSTPLSGRFGSEGHDGIQEYGYFWSSTHNRYGDYVITLRTRSSAANLIDMSGKYGASVRCTTKN